MGFPACGSPGWSANRCNLGSCNRGNLQRVSRQSVSKPYVLFGARLFDARGTLASVKMRWRARPLTIRRAGCIRMVPAPIILAQGGREGNWAERSEIDHGGQSDQGDQSDQSVRASVDVAQSQRRDGDLHALLWVGSVVFGGPHILAPRYNNGCTCHSPCRCPAKAHAHTFVPWVLCVRSVYMRRRLSWAGDHAPALNPSRDAYLRVD